jgi:hypothetical protein
VGVERGVAVGADDAQVLEPVVGCVPVDVIEDQRHPPAVPDLALAAEFADRRLQARLVRPVRIEVVCLDRPELGVATDRRVLAAGRAHPKRTQDVGNGSRTGDRLAKLVLGEADAV